MINQFVLDQITFSERFSSFGQAAYSTPALFEAAVDKISGLIDFQIAQFVSIRQTLTSSATIANLSGAAQNGLTESVATINEVISTLTSLSTNSAGMLIGNVTGQIAPGFVFPSTFEAFLIRHGHTADYFSANYGITASNYVDVMAQYDKLIVDNAAWDTKSTAAKQAAANYANNTVVLSEMLDAVGGVIGNIATAGELLAARTVLEAITVGSKNAFESYTNIPLTTVLLDGVTNALGVVLRETGQFLSPDSELLDVFQDDTGILIVLQDRGNYSAAVVGKLLLVTAENSNAAFVFDLNTVQNTQFDTLKVVGSSQGDTVYIPRFTDGEVIISTGGGADTIKTATIDVIQPRKVVIDSGIGDSVNDGDAIEAAGQELEIKSGAGVDTITLRDGGLFKVDTGTENDKIIVANRGSGSIDGGDGQDTVDYSGDELRSELKINSGLELTLANEGGTTTVKFGGGEHALKSIEEIKLTQFKDEVVGNNQVNKFEGLGGKDILTGGGGADTLDGGADDDTVDYSKESGGGIKITLGSGNNISVVDSSGSTDTLISIEKVNGTSKEDRLTLNTLQTDIELDLGEGEDTIDLTNAGSGVTVDLYSDKVGSLEILNAEHIIGTSGADNITGNDESNRLVGGGGIDGIDGGGGDDIIFNGDDKGSDDNAKETLYGGDGHDTYHIGEGDTVSDSDGIGQVFYEGKIFSGGYLKYWSRDYSPSTISDTGPLGKVWYDDQDTEYYYDAVFGLTGLTYKLTIETKDGKLFYVENFNKQDATVGIVLSDETPKDRLRSPLIIDLDGDGVQTTSDAGVYFDVDNDGIRELTGWSSPTDGLLALDIDQNGRIDDVSELFGYGETLTWPRGPQGQFEELIEESWSSGFEQLASLQTVFDGILDSQDEVYNVLKLWTDSNQNGVTDSDELLGLADHGITSINLNAESALIQQGQNWITDFSTVTYSDGTTRDIGDVWFGFDQQNVKYDKVDISEEIKSLPYLRSIGAVLDLHSAAANDPTLAGLLKDVSLLTTNDVPVLFDTLEAVLMRWLLKGNDPASTSRGEFSDAVHVAAIEARDDTPFRQLADFASFGPNPRPLAGAMIEALHQEFLNREGLKLLLQTDLGAELLPEISFTFGVVDLSPEATGIAIINRFAALAPQDQVDRLGFWSSVLRLIDPVIKSLPEVTINLTADNAFFAQLHTLLSAQGINYSYQELVSARIDGDEASEIFLPVRSYGNAYGSGIDLVGSLPSTFTNIVQTGAGDDEIRVSYNTKFRQDRNIDVIWCAGHGNDELVREATFWGASEESGDVSEVVNIIFGGLQPDDVTFSSNENFDLFIKINATDETFSIREGVNWHEEIKLTFADGTTYKAISSELGTDELFLKATEGDDSLVDYFGVNLIEGQGGDDRLFGRGGDDTYVFERGDGYDYIFEEANPRYRDTADRIKFGEGIVAEDLEFSRNGESLNISIRLGGDIFISNEFRYQDGGAIDFVELFDGSIITYDEIMTGLTGNVNFLGVVHGWNWSDAFNVGVDAGVTFNGGGGADYYNVSTVMGSFTLTEQKDAEKPFGDPTDQIYFDANLLDVKITRTDADIFEFSLGVGHLIKVDTSQYWTQVEYIFGDITLDHSEMVTEIMRREVDGGITLIRGTSADEVFNGTSLADEIHARGGSDTIYGNEGDDLIIAGTDSTSVDNVFGGGGNDFIEVPRGNVTGGQGDDLILTELSNIYFNLGDGHDTVFADVGMAGFETLSHSNFFFGEGINASSLRYSFVELTPEQLPDNVNYGSAFGQYMYTDYGLKIEVIGHDDSLTIFSSGLPQSIANGATLDFNDNSAMTLGSILAGLRTGNNGDQLIVGSALTETLSGGLGNDILVGQDSTILASRQDTFAYALGDGNDIIEGRAGYYYTADEGYGATLLFDAHVDENLVKLQRTGTQYQDLLITLMQNNQTILVKDQFEDVVATGYLHTISFDGVSSWNLNDIYSKSSGALTVGDDFYIGSAGFEIIDGAAGNDTLIGGVWETIYKFGHGSGTDVIIEDNREPPTPGVDIFIPTQVADELHFATGIVATDLIFAAVGETQSDLQVKIKNSEDSVLIKNQFSDTGNWGFETAATLQWIANGAEVPDPYYQSGIEIFTFADGTSLTRTEVLALVTERQNNGDNTLSTGLTGGILDGGIGSDVLNGGAGNDTYIFASGYGEDIAKDSGGEDTLKIGANVDAASLAFNRVGVDGKDLLIEVDGPDRLAMTVKGQFDNPNSRIENIELPDGTFISWQNIENYILKSQISSNNDVITGFESSETIVSRGGDDIISTGGGNDFVDGGVGWDTVRFDGPVDRYTITTEGDKTYVTDLGQQGYKVTLKNVEKLEFLPDADPANNDTLLLSENLAPTTVDALFVQSEDSAISISKSDLLSFATDPEGGSLSVAGVSNAQNGTVSIDRNGNIVFVPNQGFIGTASFDYLVVDAGGLSVLGTAEIGFTSANDAPILSNQIAAVTSPEDQAVSFSIPNNTFIDADGDSLSFTATLTNGSPLPAWLTLDHQSGTFVGQPPANFNGVLHIKVFASDGMSQINTMFDLNITSVNDLPIVNGTIAPILVAEGQTISIQLPAQFAADVDDSSFSYFVSAADGNSLPSWITIERNTGEVTVEAPQGANGSYSFKLNVFDGEGFASTIVQVAVSEDNVAPVLALPVADQTSGEDQAIAVSLPAGMFLDADGDTLAFSATLSDGAALPAWLVIDTTTGAITGTPPANFNGRFVVKLTASDGTLSATDEFELTVAAVNDAPVLSSIIPNVNADEDIFVSFALPANLFIDVDNPQLTLSATLADGSSLPLWLVFDAATGGFSGTPPSNFNGNVDLTVIAFDGEHQTAGTFTLAITPINDAPILANALADVTTAEDQSVNFTLPANAFSDVDGDVLSLSAKLSSGVALPAWLAFDVVTRTFSGTPPLNFNGTVSVEVTASDGVSNVTDTFVINITAVNDAPINAESLLDQSSLEDQSLSIVLPSSAFTDVDGDTLAYSATLADGAALPGWLVVNAATGALSGTPPANFNGVLDVKLIASDGTASVSDVFKLTITAVNDAPVVSVLVPDTSSLEEQAVNFVIPANSFLDVDGNALTLTATLSNGDALPAWLSFNGTTGAFTGTPPQNFNGSLNVKVTASDGELSAFDSFTLAITPVNDAPVVAQLLADVQSIEDTAINFSLPANAFSDVDNSSLTYSATLGSGAALPAWLSFNAATQSFSGVPPQNFSGSIDVEVSASDGILSTSDVFTLTITPVNDAPVVATLLPDRSFAEDTALNFTVPAGSFSDVDNAALTFSASLSNGAALPSWLTFNAGTQTFSGTPPQNFNGSLDVKVTASDGALSASDVFALSITPVNDAPVVAQLLADVLSAEDTAISFTLSANAFSDVDNSNLTYSATLASGAALPSWLSFNATTRQFSGIPPLNFFGALDVRVTASDGTLATSDVFTLNVTPVNDAPVAVNDGPLAATFNSALTISAASLLANDSDVESTTLSIASVQGGVNGTVALNAAGNVMFTPTTGFSGSASFTYTLSDGSGGTSSATVALSVSTGSNIINGTTGSNILFGTATNDLINSLTGDDVVIAGDGNDTIYAGSGTDFVEAGSGNDVIYGEAGGDILYANDGDDIAYGGDGNDIVIGANGDDLIYGDLGNDNLSGGAGNDTLYGGAGVDTMYGGTGNDRLSGQAGNDTMSGETGSDTFVFAAGFGKDRITDFQAGTAVSDVIQLSLGANFDTFAEILAATTNVQGNAVITISPADTITLVGINKTALVDNDFLFT